VTSLLFLVAHIGAAILFIGPTTLASSVFARYATPETRQVAEALHHVTRSYGMATLVIPAIGVALAAQRAHFTQGWLLTSSALFILALGLLGAVIVPAQSRALDALDRGTPPPAAVRRQLHLGAGLFALTWVVILALMVAKPF
jgi:hypothetical protein